MTSKPIYINEYKNIWYTYKISLSAWIIQYEVPYTTIKFHIKKLKTAVMSFHKF